MQKINVQALIQMEEDFHIGTGMSDIGLYDDSQYKEHGHVSIPSSSFKGILRDSCRQIQTYMQEFGDPKAVLYRDIYDRIFKSYNDLNSLDIYIKPLSDNDAKETVIHYFTAIDSQKGKAQKGSLRSQEYGAKSLCFELRLTYYCENRYSEDITEYLKEALQNIKSLGGNRRRGFGALQIKDIQSSAIDIKSDPAVDVDAKNLRIMLRLDEDTLISAKGQSGNLQESNDYIAGSSILGMLRAKLLSQKINRNFLDDGVIRTSFFYPLPDFATSLSDIVVHPVYLSLRRRKDYLKGLDDARDIPLWAYEDNRSNLLKDIVVSNSINPLQKQECPSKGMNEGYMLRPSQTSSIDEISYFKVNKNLHQRNRISKRSQRTEHDGVFIESRVKKDTRFVGDLCFPDVETCKSFCEIFSAWLNGDEKFHIGRGGKPCTVVEWHSYSDSEKPTVAAQIDEEFTISFLSDVILFDDLLRPVTHFDEEILASLLSDAFSKDSFVLLNYSERSGIFSSFSGTSGLRKFRDLTLRKGSCYRFKVNSNLDKNLLAAELYDLEKSGIGIRKHEGFGAVSINDPIHDLKTSDVDIDTAKPSPIKLCHQTQNREKSRLNRLSSIYIEADQLKKRLEESNKDQDTKKGWLSLASWILAIISENPTDQDFYETINDKITEKTDPNNQGNWGQNDFRLKLLTTITKYSKRTKSVEIALKNFLHKHGGHNG